MPQRRTLASAPTALQGDRNGNHGFNSLATHQAKACGHPARPAGKGGNRKARNTSHTRQLQDLPLEEERGCLTLPQALPRPRSHGGSQGTRARSTFSTESGKARGDSEPGAGQPRGHSSWAELSQCSPHAGVTLLSRPARSRDHKRGFSSRCSLAERPAQCVGTVDKSWL